MRIPMVLCNGQSDIGGGRLQRTCDGRRSGAHAVAWFSILRRFVATKDIGIRNGLLFASKRKWVIEEEIRLATASLRANSFVDV